MFVTPVPPTCPSLESDRTAFTSSGSLNAPNGTLIGAISSQQIKDTVGIIIPPSNIKGIIDKTAEFVAKNGLEFQQRILADRSNGSKFAFLVPGNPYRPYYDAKVAEFQTGEVKEEVQQQIPQAILEMRRRELEKKNKKKQILSLTSSSIVNPGPDSLRTDLVSINEGDSFLIPSTGEPLEECRPVPAPPDDQYSAPRPPIAPIDMDVIKLTAQYVARNGQKFLVGLGQRERGNLQFSFLRMNHPLFPYFTTLVDAYARCFVPPKGVISTLKEDIGLESRFSSGQHETDADQKTITPMDVLSGCPEHIGEAQLTAMLNILERVDARHQWECFEEKRKDEEAKQEADERQKMHAMDWHEFAVVEVIHFTEEDDSLLLRAPIDQASTLTPAVVPLLHNNTVSYDEDLKKAHLVEDSTEPWSTIQEKTDTLHPDSGTPTPCSPPLSTPSSTVPAEPPMFHALINTPTPTPSAPPASSGTSTLVTPLPLTIIPQQSGFTDGPPEPAFPPATPIVVVKDYVRQGKKRGKESEDMQKCPITGQWIPIEKMSDHLRILLLDPKWKEEKDILLSKAQKESAFAPLSDFETNLANFVVKRPDLFGTVEDECESNYVPPMKRHS